MDWKFGAPPNWGCFIVAVLAIVLQVIWRLHDKNADIMWVNQLSLYVPAALIAGAFVTASILNWKAAKQQRKTTPELENPVNETEIKIAKIDDFIEYYRDSKLGYPLKMRIQMRNDCAQCADIRVSKYLPGSASAKQPFPLDVLQLKCSREWIPEPNGAERIAVLPGQSFRTWIGFDDTLNKGQLEQRRGKLGTLVLLVNGQGFDIPL